MGCCSSSPVAPEAGTAASRTKKQKTKSIDDSATTTAEARSKKRKHASSNKSSAHDVFLSTKRKYIVDGKVDKQAEFAAWEEEKRQAAEDEKRRKKEEKRKAKEERRRIRRKKNEFAFSSSSSSSDSSDNSSSDDDSDSDKSQEGQDRKTNASSVHGSVRNVLIGADGRPIRNDNDDNERDGALDDDNDAHRRHHPHIPKIVNNRITVSHLVHHPPSGTSNTSHRAASGSRRRLMLNVNGSAASRSATASASASASAGSSRGHSRGHSRHGSVDLPSGSIGSGVGGGNPAILGTQSLRVRRHRPRGSPATSVKSAQQARRARSRPASPRSARNAPTSGKVLADEMRQAFVAFESESGTHLTASTKSRHRRSHSSAGDSSSGASRRNQLGRSGSQRSSPRSAGGSRGDHRHHNSRRPRVMAHSPANGTPARAHDEHTVDVSSSDEEHGRHERRSRHHRRRSSGGGGVGGGRRHRRHRSELYDDMDESYDDETRSTHSSASNSVHSNGAHRGRNGGSRDRTHRRRRSLHHHTKTHTIDEHRQHDVDDTSSRRSRRRSKKSKKKLASADSLGANGGSMVRSSSSNTNMVKPSRVISEDEFNSKWEPLGVLGASKGSAVVLMRPHGQPPKSDTDYSMLVAVKALDKAYWQKHDAEHWHERLLEHKEVLRVLQPHPFIVRMLFDFEVERKLVLGLEVVRGPTLKHLLNRHGKLSVERARFYAAELLLALGHMHHHRIVFRDLRPHNVMIDEHGHVRVIDFASAARLSKDRKKRSTLVGARGYKAPEMLDSAHRKYSHAVDWWSFGIVLHEMLTGSHPFQGKLFGLRKADDAVLDESWQIKYPKNMDLDGRALVSQLLQRDPKQRLGNSSRHAMEEIKAHPFFKDVDWLMLSNKRVAVPWTPNLKKEVSRALVKVPSEVTGKGLSHCIWAHFND